MQPNSAAPQRQITWQPRSPPAHSPARHAAPPHRPPQVFLVEATGEVFRNYSAYVAKAEAYKKSQWACKYSGKGGLTMGEAVEEERKALAALAKVRRKLHYLARI